jgi:hypothetical protein
MRRVHFNDHRCLTTRRLPAPWCTEKMPGGYVVRDANGKALAYIFCRANEAEAGILELPQSSDPK